MPSNIYLDVCCLNRPFDDQSQPRIRLEAEAVLYILEQCDAGYWTQIASEVSRVEVLAIDEPVLRRNLLRLLPPADQLILVEDKTETRARKLIQIGFKPADALHLASAEEGAEVFLTCDDRLFRLARRMKRQLKIAVENPLQWLEAQK